MTRINTVPVESLCREHLLAEIRELPRAFTLARKNTTKYKNAYQWKLKKKPPEVFILGEGHVNFFVDKLGYLLPRYHALCDEWRARGYTINQVSDEDLLFGIHKSFVGDYTPTQDAIAKSVERINSRLKEMRNAKH